MDYSDASRQFQWRDKCGLVWDVYVVEDPVSVSWFARPGGYVGGRCETHLQTHTIDLQQQLSMAHLMDVQVNRHMENRGVGSMLVQEAAKECKLRGHRGIEGDISSVDSDHFDKLKHFYEKMGFSVVLYPPEHPDYNPRRVGKVELMCSQH